jgi:ribosomal protein S3
MTHTRKAVMSPFERIASFARGVVTVPLQYGAVTVKVQIVAEKHLPSHIACLLSNADLSEASDSLHHQDRRSDSCDARWGQVVR